MAYHATPEQVVRTLFTYMEKRGFDNLLHILTMASPTILFEEHDNWNGGIDFYSLCLEIPTSLYASLEDIEVVENLFNESLEKLFRDKSGDVLNRVRFRPQLEDGHLNSSPVLKDDAYRIWKDGFRLFISHSSVQKDVALSLQKELADYEISSFVAHVDIEPNSFWQSEIEIALRSMHAMVAIISPDFQKSIWANQEIGFGLGRDISIMCVLAGSEPKGFLGNRQGISINNAKQTILDLLIKSSSTHLQMRKALCRSMKFVRSFNEARARLDLLPPEEAYTAEEKEFLRQSLTHGQIFRAPDVLTRVQKLIGDAQKSVQPVQSVDDLPF